MLGLRQSLSRDSSRMARIIPSSVFSAALPPHHLQGHRLHPRQEGFVHLHAMGCLRD